MCGRYSLAPSEFSEIGLEFDVELQLELPPRYNVAPTWSAGHEAPIVHVVEGGARKLELARWWFIPEGWSRPLSGLPTAFNARSEELAERKFWGCSFESQRCLVPVTGWREYAGERGHRQAFHFHYAHALFAFAGLWSRWQSPEGELVQSFAIITTAANEVVRPVHDRMPLRIERAQYARWLDPEVPGAAALQAVLGSTAPALESYESDPIGNDPRREGPECIAPAPQLGLFDR